DFLIQGGLSSVIARGERVPDHSGWSVDIKHPHDREQVLARVPLRQQALGTSGAEAQHFYDEQGRQLGHVIDPRSGRPADSVVSVTAVASDGATADALATACYVLGPEQTHQLCERESNLGAVFVQAGQAGPAGQTKRLTRGYGVLQGLTGSPPGDTDSDADPRCG
ncbi:MAG: FAD:protein FMN transferase, partial [Planctomycetota bacterium]